MTHTESTPTPTFPNGTRVVRKHDGAVGTVTKTERVGNAETVAVRYDEGDGLGNFPGEVLWGVATAFRPVFDERALADTDAIIDMTGMTVTSTAAILAIRAAVQYRADQAQARYLAAQHGSYAVGRGRAMVARDTWREALALVDTVIAERMS
jgi:hypothetical protein